MKCPVTPADWKNISDLFWKRWNFPHTCGGIDGKHIAIKKPANSGSLYFNYKGFFSIVMLALVDADYKFVWVDIGSRGASSDVQIFNNFELKECMEDNANHNLIHGEWRRGRNMTDMDKVVAPNSGSRKAKKQRLLLKHYLSSPAGSVPWQKNMV